MYQEHACIWCLVFRLKTLYSGQKKARTNLNKYRDVGLPDREARLYFLTKQVGDSDKKAFEKLGETLVDATEGQSGAGLKDFCELVIGQNCDNW